MIGSWNPIRRSPVNVAASSAILVCALLASFTDLDWAATVVIGISILELGVLGVWILDRRRLVTAPSASS